MTKLRLLMAAGIVAALAFAQAAQADWTLVTADFAEQRGLTVNTWDISGGLSATGESGKLVKFDTANVLSLTSNHPRSAVNGGGAGWSMSLRNGDILYGEPTAISGQSIMFNLVDVGPVMVPLKVVAGLALAKPADAVALASGSGPVVTVPAPADNDVVHLKNGDTVKGLIVNVDPQKLQISVGDANPVTTDLDMANVDHFTFAGVTPSRPIPTLSARLQFLSGSVLTIPLDAKQKSFSWSINDVSFKDLGGQERKAGADTLAGVDILGGRVVYLTDLDPAKDEQSTFIGTQWPTQINRNVLGDPLRVGKKTYSRGLGVHTKSDLTYDLDGSFATLKFRVGMDDSAAPEGAADVSVLLDGKVIWQAKGLKATGEAVEEGKASPQVSAEISLPIKGGKKLELRADPVLDGGKVDVLGRVDWLDAALVRP